MAEISPALARALWRGDAQFLLFEADHPAGYARYWTRTGILRWGGYRWIGAGILGKIAGVSRSVDLTINQTTFEIAGVPPQADELLSALVRGRQARVPRGAISARGIITVDDAPTIDATMDYQTLSIDPSSGQATISIKAFQGFYVLDRAQDIALTDQQQRQEFPDDCGMALAHMYVNRDSNWRAA